MLYTGSEHGRRFKLVKLFGPEHGIDGLTPAGKPFNKTRDRHTGLPVYPLFQTAHGDFRHPERGAIRRAGRGRL